MKGLDEIKLQIGDIILTTENHLTSKTIRVATMSDISHAMLYVARGSVIDSTPGEYDGWCRCRSDGRRPCRCSPRRGPRDRGWNRRCRSSAVRQSYSGRIGYDFRSRSRRHRGRARVHVADGGHRRRGGCRSVVRSGHAGPNCRSHWRDDWRDCGPGGSPGQIAKNINRGGLFGLIAGTAGMLAEMAGNAITDYVCTP
jgi:hypothetical protein